MVRTTGLSEPKRRLDEWSTGLLDSGRARVGVYGVVEHEDQAQPGCDVWVDVPETGV